MTCTRQTHRTTLAATQAANRTGGEVVACKRCGWFHVRPKESK